MTPNVFIDGAHGTTGLEIRERLGGRTDLSLILLDEADRRDEAKRTAALNDADAVVLCLPDDAARAAVALIRNPRTRVVDASTAFRIADGWTYGLPELEPQQPAAIAESLRVANPGCWPTGFLLLVRPLVRLGLVPHDWPLSYGGASGYSGGGKAMIAEYEGGEESALRGYAYTLQHKHLPEMQRHARMAHPPIFQPAVARTYRGMLTEVPLPLHALPRRPTPQAIEEVLADSYRASPVVHVAPATEGALVRVEEEADTDRIVLRVFGHAESGQARLTATYDNLGKGAAGAAVQNLNLMLGLEPTAGLTL